MFRVEAISKLSALPVGLSTSIFPGGEVHVCIDDSQHNHPLTSVRVTAHIRNPSDQMMLFMLTDAVRRNYGSTPIHLRMPYVAYARQDRVCNRGEALAAKVFCQMINAQGYESVTIFDPHSDVVPALIDRVVVQDASVAVGKILDRPEYKSGVTFISPDAGAQKRVMKLAKRFGVDAVLCADKVRNTKTGAIERISFSDPVFKKQNPGLVIDDICDGGATFIALSRAVTDQEIYITTLDLYISHGIFSKGVCHVAEHYNHVFAGYNWPGKSNEKLTTIFED